jgi:hypothetical protein
LPRSYEERPPHRALSQWSQYLIISPRHLEELLWVKDGR